MLKLSIVFGVRPDPNTKDAVGVSDTDRPVVYADADRPQRGISGTDGFELEAWVKRVLAEHLMGVPSLALDWFRQGI